MISTGEIEYSPQVAAAEPTSYQECSSSSSSSISTMSWRYLKFLGRPCGSGAGCCRTDPGSTLWNTQNTAQFHWSQGCPSCTSPQRPGQFHRCLPIPKGWILIRLAWNQSRELSARNAHVSHRPSFQGKTVDHSLSKCFFPKWHRTGWWSGLTYYWTSSSRLSNWLPQFYHPHAGTITYVSNQLQWEKD